MGAEADYAQLIGRRPSADLLGQAPALLPDVVEPPERPAASRARSGLVALGATLTGVTLLAGLALLVLGVVQALGSGVDLGSGAALAFGAVLVATHWGWVHVAEATAAGLEGRRNREAERRRQRWLEEVKPFTRYVVSTHPREDGSIMITTVAHRPVPGPAQTFRFIQDTVAEELHGADEPAAAITERAELLRRRAAAATAAEQERWSAAQDAYDRSVLAHEDEQQRLVAVRAASQALSERINANLRDPPLTE